ncbi:retinal short-chain dehydrogenase/reductase [Sistotremastrum niveocremeum HHB9708]|uniref:Short-chain dehydrogenase/reductase 3 n=1 Tax=Sistotremastrum niveocremeum HHB9708 TaxID=1314777 RepID=A0A164ZPW1_9AGAM|nr:retinal short-chain dehydrogenase/reductase [Sistotremastrum niveocremeum HHB9708]
MDAHGHDEPTQIFDNLDLDLIVKVLSHTAFSPFFTFFIPIMYRAQGAEWSSSIIRTSLGWFFFTFALWFAGFVERIYKNNGSLLFRGERCDWGEQIVLITGGSSGVGALLANTLAVRNVTVVVLDVVPIVTENYNINFYECDVSNWEAVSAVHQKIVDEVGHPTIIINNAGIVHGKSLLDLAPKDIERTFNVNVLGYFWILKAFLPELLKQKSGHIVTVGSVLGLLGIPSLSDYCASKAAVINLHETLRYELDTKYCTPNIRTTLLMPGHIETEMFSGIKMPESFLNKFVAPRLAPHTVVKAIIAALDDQESRTIRLPFYTHLVPWINLSPSYIQDFFHWFSGSNDSMNDFTKRNVSAGGELSTSSGKEE